MFKNSIIAIYPTNTFDQVLIENYLDRAKKSGFQEVFTSAHLPEVTFEDSIWFLEQLITLIKKRKMYLTVDIGGNVINDILSTNSLVNRIRNIHIDCIRVDYGFPSSIILELRNALEITSFQINASLITEKEIAEYVAILQVHPEITIEACHNFYPRPETGLDLIFLKKQYHRFNHAGIKTICCVADDIKARGPLYQGLPTVEELRHATLERNLVYFIQHQICDRLMFADEFLNDNDFDIIDRIIIDKMLFVRVVVEPSITTLEQSILQQSHQIRIDSNCRVLRSQTSREMARFANKIPINNCKKRKPGHITIDNELYLRYSGELQVILENMPLDNKVNVIAKVHEEDLWKFDIYRHGYMYQFIII